MDNNEKYNQELKDIICDFNNSEHDNDLLKGDMIMNAVEKDDQSVKEVIITNDNEEFCNDIEPKNMNNVHILSEDLNISEENITDGILSLTENNKVDEIKMRHIDNDLKVKSNDNSNITNKTTPTSISQFYLQFNASWKDRLKSRSLKEQSYSTMNESTHADNSSDIDVSEDDIVDDEEQETPQEPLLMNSSCCSASDELNVLDELKSKTVNVSNGDSGFSSECKTPQKEPKFAIRRPVCVESSCYSASDENDLFTVPKPKNVVVSSIDCGLESNSVTPKNGPKFAIRRPVCVESSCYSASDENTVLTAPKPKNVAVASTDCGFDSDCVIPPKDTKVAIRRPTFVDSSFSSDIRERSTPVVISENKDKPKMATTATGTESAENNVTQSALGTQIDETFNHLEEKILPFVRNPHTVELRLRGRLSIFQRACVKQIASQHKLVIKYFGKGKDSFVMLRKKVELLNAQKLFLEMKKNEIEKKKEQITRDKAKKERLLNPPIKVSSSCQADFPDDKEEAKENSKNAARRNRKKQWELKQKEMSKRNSATQTVANGFYLCPYCEGDIPESHQSLHYPYCLSKYRSQMQSACKSGNNNKEKKSVISQPMRPASSDRKHRSKSRDKIQSSTILAVRKELDKIHSNDINSMLNVLTELSKKCSVSGCTKKKQKTCDECMVAFCGGHYAPETESGTVHFNCPVALERAAAERQKKLGANNPLLKTVAELSAPRFPDGALIRKPKRVRMAMTPSVEEPLSGTVTSVVATPLPPNVNETRTRNGPILSYERNQLHRKLRERICGLSDRRTK